MFHFQDNTAPPPLGVRESEIDTTIHETWKKIVTHDEPFGVYIDRKKRLLCARMGTTRQVTYSETASMLLVGIYNAAIRKADFTEDVLYAITCED